MSIYTICNKVLRGVGRRIIIGRRSRLLVRHVSDDFACRARARAPQEGNRASLSDTSDSRDLNALTAKLTNSIIIINQLRSASDRKPGRQRLQFFRQFIANFVPNRQAQQMSDVRRKSWPPLALSVRRRRIHDLFPQTHAMRTWAFPLPSSIPHRYRRHRRVSEVMVTTDASSFA